MPGSCEACVRAGLAVEVLGVCLPRSGAPIMAAWVLLALLHGAPNYTTLRHLGDSRTLSQLRTEKWAEGQP